MIYLLGLVMLMSLVNAGTFVFDPEDAESLADTSEGNNGFEVLIFGQDNLSFTAPVSNDTIYYDVNFEVILSDDMFFVYDNANEGDIITISYNFDNKELSPGIIEVFTTSINFTESGNFVFAFEPDFEGERLELWIDYPNSVQTIETFKFTRQRGIGDVTNTFVTSMTDLVEINIGIWKIMFFSLLVGIVIMVIGVVGAFIFEVIDWAEKFREKRNKHLRRKRD